MIGLFNICNNTRMASNLKIMSLIIMWFVICNTVFKTNAFETYDETDQLAEESTEEYDDKGHDDETTTMTIDVNYDNLDVKTNAPKEKRLAKESADDDEEDETSDPLQKILPKVKFNCKGKSEGYYADNEFCEVFHYCKTNGFRFTFMCPQETYYNTKLMACEFNSSVSLCKHQINLKINNTINRIVNTNQDIGIKPSAGQQIEVFEKPTTSTEKLDPITTSTTTVSTTTTTVTADPYLTKRRTTHRPRSTSKPRVFTKPPVVKTPQKTEILNTNEKQNETSDEGSKPTETLAILPFRGFGRHNRTRNRKTNKNKTISQLTKNNTNTAHKTDEQLPIIANDSQTSFENLTQNSERIAETGDQITNTYRRQLINNLNRRNSYKTRSRTTTTAAPSLIRPTTNAPTTVPPYDFFQLIDSENRFQTNPDLYSLSSQQNHDNKQTKNRKPPVLTQNYFNTIFHIPNNETMESEPNVRETSNAEIQNQPNSESFAELPSFLSKEVQNEEFLDLNPFNRAPVFDNFFENQSKKSIKLRVPQNDAMKPSESQRLSLRQMFEKFKQMGNNQEMNPNTDTSGLSEEELDGQQSEHKEQTDDNVNNEGDSEGGEQLLTVPVLVPTGMSKNFMKQSIGTTLLRPTMIPLSDGGQQIPAYILQFPNNNRNHKRKHNKHRQKRQIFGWSSSPYYRNSYEGQQYLPMTSVASHVYSNGYPLNAYHQSPHIHIGEKPGFTQSAQQQLPYYMPPRQTYSSVPNNFISNSFDNIYDLNEFSDFYSNKRPNLMMSADVIPYRSVSLKRPTFKRPPQRERIPQMKRDGNDTTLTTPIPVTAVPVSPRPHRYPLTRRPFYAMNSNPFSDFSEDSLGEAIKLFDSNEDNYQELRSSDFDSQALFPFNSGRSFSNSDFIPMAPKSRPFTGALNSRASGVGNTFSQLPVNTFEPNYDTNIYSDNFPPFPQFGDPDYRLPFVEMPDQTQRHLGLRPKHNANSVRKESERKEDNNITSSVRYSTPYSPEVLYIPQTETQKSNETERNPNHNYDTQDKEEIQTARTEDFLQDIGPASRLEWQNLVGRFNTPNASLNQIKLKENISDQKVQNEGQIQQNKYVSYGTRLTASDSNNNNSTVSVKSSVRVVSSLQPEASNQVMISKKLGSSLPSSEEFTDENYGPNTDQIYNPRTSDRLMLFNYYNNINLYNPMPKALKSKPNLTPYSTHTPTTTTTATTKIPTTTTTTTTPSTTPMNPYTMRYPSTSHWSIRDWSGQYYPNPTSTTPSPIITTKPYYNFEIIDLNESETTTQTSVTTTPITIDDIPAPPYETLFDTKTNSNPKIYTYSQKTRSDISQYLNSLNLT